MSYIRTEKYRKLMSQKLKGRFKGEHHSPKTEFKKGEPRLKEIQKKRTVLKGKNSPLYGKPRSKEIRQKIKQKLLEYNLKYERPKEIRIKQGITMRLRKRNQGTKNYFYNKHFFGEENGMYGKHPSETTKMKMSLASKGKPKSEEHKIKMSLARKLFSYSEESKRKMSETKKRLFAEGKLIPMKAEKNPNWQGGIAHLPYKFEFNDALKEKIRERDNYTCQECNKNQFDLNKKLAVHHIDYNKNNNFSHNLISLCNHCHGLTQVNREHWKKYFKMQMFIKELFNPKNILIYNENKQLIGMEKIEYG